MKRISLILTVFAMFGCKTSGAQTQLSETVVAHNIEQATDQAQCLLQLAEFVQNSVAKGTSIPVRTKVDKHHPLTQAVFAKGYLQINSIEDTTLFYPLPPIKQRFLIVTRLPVRAP